MIPLMVDSSESGSSEVVTYKQAGVDVDRGDALVDWLADSADLAGRKDPRILSGIGGFAAVFRPEFKRFKDPCLVAATDGVGTKILLGARFKRFEVVAQDLVAMCVNDLICTGAEPLFFLDYYATSKLDLSEAQGFLSGVQKACQTSGCALIGGETAEMPGLYQPSDFDAAGFAVGIVDRHLILGAQKVTPGSVILGVHSSGFHSNGFSLLRRLFAKEIEAGNEEVLNWLLRPTALYPPLAAALKVNWERKSGSLEDFPVQAIAHITGGGMENLPRVLPPRHEVKLLDWAWPDEFIEVQERSGLSRIEMLKTLNCGIGLALVVNREQVQWVEDQLRLQQVGFVALGDVVQSAVDEPRVVY